VIPTFNEVDNLPAMAQALFALELSNIQLLIIDDNSPDGTGRIADQLAAHYNQELASDEHPRMQVIHRRTKGGLGTAYVAGLTRALEDGAEYIVQMDADFSHSPAYIPQMLAVMQATDADVIVGSRYVPGGSLDDGWEWGRRFLSWWANIYSRLILGLRTRDMTAGFKLWRRAALLGIDLQNIRSNGYSFQVEMAYLCEKLAYRVIELPIHFEDRRIGQSKLDIPVKLESAWRTWHIRWRYRRLPAPSSRVDLASNSARTSSIRPWRTGTGDWEAGERPSSSPNP
jgi:dolichol-phosphate mannosyltransferase